MEGRFNSKGHKRWWSTSGRNLAYMMEYIATGNEPRPTMPPRTSSWLPRQIKRAPPPPARARCLQVCAPLLLSSPLPPSTPGDAPPSAAARCASTSTAARRLPALFCRLVRAKTELTTEWQPPADYVRAAAALGEQEEEWSGHRTAEEASFNTVQPAPKEFANDWSLEDFTAAEVECQRQILADLERKRAADQRQERQQAAAARRRIQPPPQAREIEYYKLDPSDNEEEDVAAYKRTLLLSKWHGGDDGAGPSKPVGDEDGSDDDGGDYRQAIYNSLGIN